MADLLTYQYPNGVKEFVPNAKNVSAQHNSIYRGEELPYTWAEIKTKITNNDFSNLYIGDYKTITLTTNETVVMEIAGICNYEGWGSSQIGHHIDFISRNCLATAYKFNETNTNNGTSAEEAPWRASALKDTLNNSVLYTLPSDLQSIILDKTAYIERRYSSGGAVSADTGAGWHSLGRLWIPSEIEVFGHATYSEIGPGTAGFQQYPIFKMNPTKIIKPAGQSGSRNGWWTLSAATNATSFCSVGANGQSGYSSASATSVCVPLCFRIS